MWEEHQNGPPLKGANTPNGENGRDSFSRHLPPRALGVPSQGERKALFKQIDNIAVVDVPQSLVGRDGAQITVTIPVSRAQSSEPP
jgi:hypothetical protein